jgi:hypothetical protein
MMLSHSSPASCGLSLRHLLIAATIEGVEDPVPLTSPTRRCVSGGRLHAPISCKI